MNRINTLVFILLLCLVSAPTLGHIGWQSIDGVACESPYTCNDEPVVLTPGANIDVVYDVIIRHGDDVTIELIANGETQVLKDGLPEISGFNSTDITLPNIECNPCSLRVHADIYSGRSDIILSHEPPVAGVAEVANVMAVAQDTEIHWMWHAEGSVDRVMILMADVPVQAELQMGQDYTVGENIGNAVLVFKGDANAWTATNLTPQTTYHIKIVTVEEGAHYSMGVAAEETTTNIGNNPPWITLTAMQGEQTGTHFEVDGGWVTVQLAVDDADSSDQHWIDWSQSNAQLINQSASDMQFRFDPQHLNDGDYEITVTVMDDGMPAMTQEQTLWLNFHSHEEMITTPISGGSGTKGGAVGILWFLTVMISLLWRSDRQK